METGKPLVLAELEVPALKPGQVLVEVTYSAVCHTQVLECRGYRGEDRFLPHCMGHEASGSVYEIGSGVTKVRAGDRVVLSWIKGSGADVGGTVYRWGDRDVNAGGVTTFGRHAVVSENRLTPLPAHFPMPEAALVGCAIPTGVGAVLNVARPVAGQSLAVFGAGGIGLCAIAGAYMSGCTPIIAVDIREDKLEIAKQAGASHTVLSGDVDPIEAIGRICPGGTDFSVECTGRPDVMEQCLRSVHPQGGAAVVIGNAPYGERMSFDPRELNQGKRLLGTWGGDSQPDRDYPRYFKLVESGRLDLSLLLSKTYSLDNINHAIDDLEAGTVTRPIVDME